MIAQGGSSHLEFGCHRLRVEAAGAPYILHLSFATSNSFVRLAADTGVLVVRCSIAALRSHLLCAPVSESGAESAPRWRDGEPRKVQSLLGCIAAP